MFVPYAPFYGMGNMFFKDDCKPSLLHYISAASLSYKLTYNKTLQYDKKIYATLYKLSKIMGSLLHHTCHNLGCYQDDEHIFSVCWGPQCGMNKPNNNNLDMDCGIFEQQCDFSQRTTQH